MSARIKTAGLINRRLLDQVRWAADEVSHARGENRLLAVQRYIQALMALTDQAILSLERLRATMLRSQSRARASAARRLSQ